MSNKTKRVTDHLIDLENRTDGFVNVHKEENWIQTGQSIREKIAREGPWASARLPSFTNRKEKGK
jgi:hypothetical protein